MCSWFDLFGQTLGPFRPMANVFIAVAGQQVPPKTLAAHAARVKGQKEIVVLMLMDMEPDLQRNMETLGAYEMLKELKTLFAQQVEQELLQTVREFHACKQENEQYVSSYVLKMKGYVSANITISNLYDLFMFC
nr:zinc finger, CCHC-type [Tanacetum cinerariifolium]